MRVGGAVHRGGQTSKALWEAIEAAGPWGTVNVGPAGSARLPGAVLGFDNWLGGAVSHRGPVLVRGSAIGGIGVRGAATPALWIESDLRASKGASSAFGNGADDLAPGPLVVRGAFVGAQDASGTSYNAAPIKWGVHFGGQVEGGIALVDLEFGLADEHGRYIQNSRGAYYEARCRYPASTRCSAGQHTNRLRSGSTALPPASGPVAIVEPHVTVSRRWLNAEGSKGVGGGGSITIAGHTGPVAILDPTFDFDLPAYPVPASGSHGNLIMVWGETFTANGGCHLTEGGWWIDEVAIAGIRLHPGTGGVYTPDRDAIGMGATRLVWFEAPSELAEEDVQFETTASQRISINTTGSDVPESGQRMEIGTLHWAGAGPSWWRLEGQGWARGIVPSASVTLTPVH